MSKGALETAHAVWNGDQTRGCKPGHSLPLVCMHLGSTPYVRGTPEAAARLRFGGIVITVAREGRGSGEVRVLRSDQSPRESPASPQVTYFRMSGRSTELVWLGNLHAAHHLFLQKYTRSEHPFFIHSIVPRRGEPSEGICHPHSGTSGAGRTQNNELGRVA